MMVQILCLKVTPSENACLSRLEEQMDGTCTYISSLHLL